MKQAFPEYYKHVLIEYRHEDHTIVLRSFNGQAHFEAVLGEPEPKTVRPNKENKNHFVFDPKKILQSFGKLKDQVFLHVDFEKCKVVVKSRNAQATDTGEPCDTFIEIPSHDGRAEPMDVPELFAKCLRRVMWATDPKSVDPACKGIYIEMVHEEEESYIEFCATNRQVISLCRDFDNLSSITGSGIIQYETASTIADMIEKGKECDLLMDDERLIVISGDFTIVASHIDAQMLNYQAVLDSVISGDFITVRVNRGQMLTGCDFASQFADAEYNHIFLNFNEKVISLNGYTRDKSKKGQYEVQYIGKAHGLALCIEYNRLQDSVKALETEELEISFDPENPRAITIKPSDQGDLYSEVFTSLSVLKEDN